jgi:prophage maintenance system killer protein
MTIEDLFVRRIETEPIHKLNIHILRKHAEKHGHESEVSAAIKQHNPKEYKSYKEYIFEVATSYFQKTGYIK